MYLTLEQVSKKNSEFWDEPCGSHMAQKLGIKDLSPESLAKFDAEYFSMYPHLIELIPPKLLYGKDILEVGLGYGTLGQYLAINGKSYYGVDIAQGPVDLMNLRLARLSLNGAAVKWDFLFNHIPSESMDIAVSIGCFHHTGDTKKCVDEVYRILRPGGTAIIMLYNKFSYRNWKIFPKATFFALLKQWGISDSYYGMSKEQVFWFDHSVKGSSAPYTELNSRKDCKRHFEKFSKTHLVTKNELFFGYFGCDMYIKAVK